MASQQAPASGPQPRWAGWYDLMVGLAALLICAIGLRELGRVPAWMLESDMGATLIPRGVLLALGGLGLVVAARGMPRLRAGASERATGPAVAPAAAARRRWGLQGLMVASLLGYVAAMPRWGFVGATLAFVGLWTLVLRWADGPGSPRSVAFLGGLVQAALVTLAIFAVFRYLVRIPLP